MATIRATLSEDLQMTTTEVEINVRTARKIFREVTDRMMRATLDQKRRDKRKSKVVKYAQGAEQEWMDTLSGKKGT